MLKQPDCENQFEDEPECQPMFLNKYTCTECGNNWEDRWPAICDDDCPKCGARHMEPYDWEEIAPCACKYTMGVT